MSNGNPSARRVLMLKEVRDIFTQDVWMSPAQQRWVEKNRAQIARAITYSEDTHLYVKLVTGHKVRVRKNGKEDDIDWWPAQKKYYKEISYGNRERNLARWKARG